MLVLLRHGESEWNSPDINQFCGWVDVHLSKRGIQQAKESGQKLKSLDIQFDITYTSFLRRAIRTCHIVLDILDQFYIEEVRRWQLNERFYGGLTGMNKHDAVREFGKETIKTWRRTFNIRPPEMDIGNPLHPVHDVKYSHVEQRELPSTESLVDVIDRVKPIYEKEILPQFLEGKRIFLSIHGTTMRALISIIDNIPPDKIQHLEIPNGIPYVYEDLESMGKGGMSGHFLASDAELEKEQNKVRNQIHAKRTESPI